MPKIFGMSWATSKFATIESMIKQITTSLLLAMVIVLAGCAEPYTFIGTPYDPPEPAPEIVGLVGDGEPFAMSQLPQKVKVLFFGYTFCPDICPLTLGEVKSAYEALGDDAEDVAIIFVTLDPERDTPQRLDAYVDAFNDNFIGVHVPLEEQEALKADYYAYGEKRYLSEDAAPDNYLMDHTGWIYVIDGDSNMRVLHGSDAAAEDIASDVRYLVAN